MARGWESKSVESQIEDREAARSDKRPKLSREEIEQARRRDQLELSRRRIVSELQATHSAVYRTTLEHALRHLDGELAKLAK